MSEFDLVIGGGRVVTESGDALADLGVRDGKIAQIGGEMRGAEEIDASGMLVLPGGIDAHVHFTPTEDMLAGASWCDDFVSGTAAALAGGVTAVGNMTFPRGAETMAQAIQRESEEADANALTDVFLHPVLTNPASQPLDDIERFAAAGISSLKFFMSFGGYATEPEPYLQAMRRARAAGQITLIHCEDHAIMANALRDLTEQGKVGIEHYPASRPVAAEASATNRAVAMAEITGAPTYIVHLSSELALNEVRAGRSRGVPLWIETRPLYLHLTEERFLEPDGAKYVGQPPLRTLRDRQSLWAALAAGEIDTVCTDHAPWTYADKMEFKTDINTLRPGVADLDTMLPMLFSEGVSAGRISLQRFVAASSTNAAKLFGLFPRKGTIAVGSDADLAIWDPNLTKPVRAETMHTKADYSPYEGWKVTGWPVTTIHAGEVVYRDGMVLAKPGRGGIIRRDPTRPL
jgi:dihydropyrimidinase